MLFYSDQNDYDDKKADTDPFNGYRFEMASYTIRLTMFAGKWKMKTRAKCELWIGAKAFDMNAKNKILSF